MRPACILASILLVATASAAADPSGSLSVTTLRSPAAATVGLTLTNEASHPVWVEEVILELPGFAELGPDGRFLADITKFERVELDTSAEGVRYRLILREVIPIEPGSEAPLALGDLVTGLADAGGIVTVIASGETWEPVRFAAGEARVGADRRGEHLIDLSRREFSNDRATAKAPTDCGTRFRVQARCHGRCPGRQRCTNIGQALVPLPLPVCECR